MKHLGIENVVLQANSPDVISQEKLALLVNFVIYEHSFKREAYATF